MRIGIKAKLLSLPCLGLAGTQLVSVWLNVWLWLVII